MKFFVFLIPLVFAVHGFESMECVDHLDCPLPNQSCVYGQCRVVREFAGDGAPESDQCHPECPHNYNCINGKCIRYAEESRGRGVDKLTGRITVKSQFTPNYGANFEVDITDENQEITKFVGGGSTSNNVYYECSLIPHYEIPSYDEMFEPSDKNDTILVVDEKKLHVSKAFLSYHSEYFRALFSSNYKEGQMDEIPIEDVLFEDFALLLRTFYPNPVFPNDRTVKTLLEMGRRFLVPSAASCAEHHLISNSTIENEKMMQLADEYGMSKLLEKCVRRINTVEKAKKLKKSEEYTKLSDATKLKVFDRLMDFI